MALPIAWAVVFVAYRARPAVLHRVTKCGWVWSRPNTWKTAMVMACVVALVLLVKGFNIQRKM